MDVWAEEDHPIEQNAEPLPVESPVEQLAERVEQRVYERMDELRGKVDEAAMQERMDRELRDLIKDKQELIPFDKRYPDVKTLGYDKLPRK